MARGGRRRGRGGPDLDAFYDLTYATCSVMPQGIMGTQFSYVGSEWGFMARMNSLSHAEFQQIQQANITILGTKTKSINNAVVCLIIFLGSLLIFPLFCLCCQWYKKCSSPGFSVNVKTYHALQKLMSLSSQMKVLNLTVSDNELGKQKLGILQNVVNRSKLTGFILRNTALPFGGNQGEYSDFEDNSIRLRDTCRTKGITFQANWFTSLVAM